MDKGPKIVPRGPRKRFSLVPLLVVCLTAYYVSLSLGCATSDSPEFEIKVKSKKQDG